MLQEKELLEKVSEWQVKATSEEDPFDKYISLFIAYNIFYDLYAAKKSPHTKGDFCRRDGSRATATASLVKADTLLESLKPDLREYISIIPIFGEEYWPWQNHPKSVPIAQTLKISFRDGDAENTVDLLTKWLYKVRCNLVHGEKSYKDHSQRRLLDVSSRLLDIILTHLVSRYKQAFGEPPL